MSFFRQLLGKPHRRINGSYLERWHLVPRNRWFNVYLHRFGQDDPSDLHDHPWKNCSLVLRGRYREHFHDGSWLDRSPGALVLRGSMTLHRLEILTPSVTTLFVTGPVRRSWGFMTHAGWLPFQRYKDVYPNASDEWPRGKPRDVR